MSGKPNTDQVNELVAAVRRLQVAKTKIQQLEDQIVACKAELEKQQAELRLSKKQIFELMAAMDVVSRENIGWEHRIIEFLLLFDWRANVEGHPLLYEVVHEGGK